MKNLQLTEEHKAKLLEMCKSLFPEYPDVQFGIKEKHNWSIDYLVFGIMGDEPIIHWFEFCSRYLMSKLDNLYFEKIMYPVDPFHISNRNKDLKYPDNWQKLWSRRPFLMFTNNLNGIHYKEHPVDYLYEEFKKLK